MALEERNIRVVTSLGRSECFVCDKKIKEGERVIEVEFKLLLTVRKELHAGECVDKLCSILVNRSMEAGR